MIGRSLFFCDAADTSLAKIFVLVLTHRLKPLQVRQYVGRSGKCHVTDFEVNRLKRRFFWGDPTRWRKSWGQFLAWKTIRRNTFFEGEIKKHPGENGKKPCVVFVFSAGLNG